MKNKIGLAVLAMWATSAQAAEFDSSKLTAGVGFGFDNGGVFSLHADYDIADITRNPVKARVGYDRYSIDTKGAYTWSYNVFYGGAYYDFNRTLALPRNIHPFAGLGLGIGSVSCSGTWCNNTSTPSSGGLYYIGGVQYDINNQISAELSLSGWTGLSVGANIKF